MDQILPKLSYVMNVTVNFMKRKIEVAGVIIALAVFLLSVYTVIDEPSDFELNMLQSEGVAEQGSTIPIDIIVKSIGDYESIVRISAIEQLPGVICTLSPSSQIPTYTSTATLNVQKSASPGSYEIAFKGNGADGKEHICKYLLTVTPALELKVTITDPMYSEIVPNHITVRGTITGEPNGYLWLLVGLPEVDQWWPQSGSRILPISGEWSKDAWIGAGPDKDVGKEFQILVVSVSESIHQNFIDWDAKGRETGNYEPIGLSSDITILDAVKVVKGTG